MIEPSEAQTIVSASIKKTVPASGAYNANKPLGAHGILSPEALSTFKDNVRSDKSVGVKAYRHTLAAKELSDVSAETLAGEVEEIVIEKSVPSANAQPASAIPAKPKTKKKEKPA